MKMSFKYCCSIIVLSCMLAACLPGKKQEEKVIAQAQQATQQVAAERLAADMSNAAQSLMASNNLNPDATPALQSKELQTMKCLDGKRVIAYIPRGSKIAKGGELSKTVANHIRDQLQAQFSVKAVGTNALVGECGGDPETVALNAPVLILDNVSADLSAEQGVTSVNVASCPDVEGKTVPGVIVTKTKKDGTTVTEQHCGKPIEKIATSDKNNDNITYDLSTNSVPDWKQQLLGTAGATTSFKCIVRSAANAPGGSSGKCVNVNDVGMGDRTQCDDSKQTEDFVVNPLKDNPKVSGPATAGNCGKGWTGQVVARVRSKQCKVFHGDKASDFEPAMIYEVSNVAVKCSKDNVLNIPSQCPVGNGSFYAGYQHVAMVNPVMLEPQYDSHGIPEPSLIATPSSPDLDVSAINRIKELTNSADIFKPSVNLRDIAKSDNADTQFSTALITNMGKNAAFDTINNCNVVNNGCGGDVSKPDHIVIVLDRSSSMGSTDEKVTVLPSLTQGYACHAGLSNIFTPEKSKEACSAAKQYLHQNPYRASSDKIVPSVANFVMTPWAGGNGPNANSQSLYQTMEDSLVDKTYYKPYLQFALATGWDCSGRTKVGSDQKDSFPDDMFGTCSGEQSCTTCPGSCTPIQTTTLPDDDNVQRIQAAQAILETAVRMKLNPNTKITVASFINDAPDIQTMTYCPLERQKNGVCDLTLERNALITMFERPSEVKEYLKPVTQQVTIPTSSLPVPMIKIVPNQRNEVQFHTESNHVFQAPTNNVMTGRRHNGDENKATTYQYATLKAVDSSGNALNATVTIEDLVWSGSFKESAGIDYIAPNGRVLVGRQHHGNEDGQTSYLTGAVKVNGVTATITNVVQSGSMAESRNSAYITDADHVMVGRYHQGDENKATIYTAGTIVTPCVDGLCEKACDPSQCLTGATSGPGPWQTWQEADAAGGTNTHTVNDYEYRNCKEDTGCTHSHTQCDSGHAKDCEIADQCEELYFSYFDWDTENGDGPFLVPKNKGIKNYCYERREKVMTPAWSDWKSAAVDKDNTPGNYEYRDCTIVPTCNQEGEACARTQAGSSDCIREAQCRATIPPIPFPSWQINNDSSQPGYDTENQTYCRERRKQLSYEDNDALASCLDGLGCKGKVLASSSVETCKTSKNLFSGVTSVSCKNVDMPSKLDYRLYGYAGASVDRTITRMIPGSVDDPGAVPANSSLSYGADYGGNTPLLKTIDAMLSSPDVATDLSNRRPMGFIVITDGMDNDADSTTVKSLCDKTKGDTLLTLLDRLNPGNTKSMFISLNDAGQSNKACKASVSEDKFVSQNKLSGSLVAKLADFLGVDSAPAATTVNGSVSLQRAKTFCQTNYKSSYEDHNVKTIETGPAATQRPSICRPYEEVVQ